MLSNYKNNVINTVVQGEMILPSVFSNTVNFYSDERSGLFTAGTSHKGKI
jgi:hypothetical protein